MTALSGYELRRRMEDNSIANDQRLVLTPLLDDNQIEDSEASVDMRLGSLFLAFPRGQTASIDWSTGVGCAVDRVEVPMGQQFVIHPNQFVLGETLEFVKLPSDMMAYVVTRSTWGRTGLIVATAVGIQPNFRGVITLELRNLGDVPLNLYPGTKILQLFFHTVTPPAPPARRTYTDAFETGPPKVSFDEQINQYANLKEFPFLTR